MQTALNALFIENLGLGFLPNGHRSMLRTVLDVASILGESVVVAQLLVAGTIELGEAPSLGYEDLKKKMNCIMNGLKIPISKLSL